MNDADVVPFDAVQGTVSHLAGHRAIRGIDVLPILFGPGRVRLMWATFVDAFAYTDQGRFDTVRVNGHPSSGYDRTPSPSAIAQRTGIPAIMLKFTAE